MQIQSYTLISKRTLILTGFIILKFLLQYVLISPAYDLQRDEYLHLDQATHLAWGYLSVPPVTSWISCIIGWLGNTVFWIKFFPALFGALTIVVVWKTVETLKGNLSAQVLAAFCVLFSGLLRLNTLYQPNSLDALCWTSLYYIFIKYTDTRQRSWLYVMAVVFALGFLNKYNIAFCLLGLLPAVVLSRQRGLLSQRHFYIAMLLAFLLILPNLAWQYYHHFPVVHHFKELSDRQLVHVNRSDFLKSQLLFFLGSLPVIIAGLYALLTYAPFRPYRLFFWVMVFTLAVFTFLKAKDYYAIGLYPVYIAFGAVFLADVLSQGLRKYLWPVLFLFPSLVFIKMYKTVFPNRSPEYIQAHQEEYKQLGQLRWEDGKDHPLPQDFADMLGWKELAHKVDSAYATLPDSDRTLVLCDNYGQAGAINYYTRKGVRASSFNADYINWFDLSKPYVHLIRIKDAHNKDKELQETAPYFQTAMVADSITNPFARECGTTIFVFTKAKVNIIQRIKQEIASNQ
ncbi:MAG TPA: glycosyltransferase family 39 protein [Chitinophaga sp.]|uniref:glycosyltransferase family 39 protein n=1 Tax=Chitinophaga sp. TaxID=1869181 RepID=UPI002C205603|nr:glycosyltransferase family 39 protein [Chitinophaga sp.]HVI49288.1 glycosyltransferase family 39 protein [Chitinophaga sp.]